jgi:hypothetical protein
MKLIYFQYQLLNFCMKFFTGNSLKFSKHFLLQKLQKTSLSSRIIMSTAALLIPRAIHFFVFFYMKHVQLLYFVFRYIISHDKLFAWALDMMHRLTRSFPIIWKLQNDELQYSFQIFFPLIPSINNCQCKTSKLLFQTLFGDELYIRQQKTALRCKPILIDD